MFATTQEPLTLMRPITPTSSGPADTGSTAAIDLRDHRLAELVAELTGCDEHGALHALRDVEREPGGLDDALERVAAAILVLDQPAPDGFRVAGFLRDDLPVAVR